MIYQFNLDEKDYHTHLLFTVSKSSSAIKMRNRVRFLMTLSMMIFAFIAYGNGSTGQALYFIFLTLVSFFLLPLYTRWSYKKTYLKHVRKYYADRMSETTGVEITENQILITDSQGESILGFDEIEAVNELNDIEKALVFLYLEDKDYAEISETLGISEVNARVKMNREKGKLKKLLNP